MAIVLPSGRLLQPSLTSIGVLTDQFGSTEKASRSTSSLAANQVRRQRSGQRSIVILRYRDPATLKVLPES